MFCFITLAWSRIQCIEYHHWIVLTWGYMYIYIIIKIEVMHMDHVVYGLLLGRIVVVRLAGGEPR